MQLPDRPLDKRIRDSVLRWFYVCRRFRQIHVVDNGVTGARINVLSLRRLLRSPAQKS